MMQVCPILSPKFQQGENFSTKAAAWVMLGGVEKLGKTYMLRGDYDKPWNQDPDPNRIHVIMVYLPYIHVL